MKAIKYILSAVVLSLGLTACVGDLTIKEVLDPNLNTVDKALTTEQDFTNFLAGIYTGFSTSGFKGPNDDPAISGLDGGASQYIRGLYHHMELTTYESVCNWNDQTIKNFHALNWTTDDTFIYAFYSRIYFQISLCNEFIRQINATSVAVSDKDEMIAEARTLRAYCYMHAIDCFGKGPFVDENSIIGVSPEEISRTDLYAWLETELTDIINNSALPAARSPKAYGRIDKGAAMMILAKLYLNAEVYTGTAQWAKCANVLNSIAAAGYSLHPSYKALFCADNDTCTDEIIWAIEEDGINTQSYGATNYIIFASTGDGIEASSVGISSGWAGLRCTDTFYNLFEDADARKLFYSTDDGMHSGPITDVGDWAKGGHPAIKFTNVKADGGAASAVGFVDTDFPVFRYADVLLMYAELGLHSDSGISKAQGLSYLNQVRERAGVSALTDYDKVTIRDERGRELYQECWRRSDLIRLGYFTGSEYVWDWKGGDEKGTSVADYRAIFPIPASDLNANGNLTQHEAYK